MPRPFGISYEVFGADRVEHDLLGIAARSVNAQPALQAVAGMWRDRMEERFDSEGDGEWSSLAESTIVQKSRLGLDDRILHATEALRRSLTEADDPHHIEIITGDELIFGTSDPKARFHQDGTVKMPQRVILEAGQIGRGQQGIRDASREVQRYLIGLEGGLGQHHPIDLK